MNAAHSSPHRSTIIFQHISNMLMDLSHRPAQVFLPPFCTTLTANCSPPLPPPPPVFVPHPPSAPFAPLPPRPPTAGPPPPPPHSCYVHNRLSCPFDYFRTRARQFRDMLHYHDVTTMYPYQQTPNHITNCLAASVQ